MSQIDRAHDFARLHITGKPLILYNIWDAGSANAIAKAGAQAIATGSLSVAVPSRMITLTLAVGPFLLQDGF